MTSSTRLDDRPAVRFSSETDWAPYDFCVDGEPTGFGVEVARELGRIAGFEPVFVTDDWSALLDKLERREIDVVHSVGTTPTRSAYAVLSREYHVGGVAFLTRRGHPPIRDAHDLADRVLATVGGWDTVGFLRARYPEIDLLCVPSSEAAVRAVAEGRADAAADHADALRYHRDRVDPGLVINGRFDTYNAQHGASWRMLVRSDRPELLGTINAAIAAVPESTWHALRTAWFGQSTRDSGGDHP